LDECTSLCEDWNLKSDTSIYVHGGKEKIKGKQNAKTVNSGGGFWAIAENDEFQNWSNEAEAIYQELKERKTYQ
jgi:hypothetical protein